MIFSKKLRHRHLESELMDASDLPTEELQAALKGLDRLNRLSFASTSISKAIKNYLKLNPSIKTLSILDVACGDGQLLRSVIKNLRETGVECNGKGIDINPTSISEAQKRCNDDSIRFEVRDALQEPQSESFDIVISSLFLHHLSENNVVQVLRTMRGTAKRLVIVNDLRRSTLNLVFVWIGAKLVTRSYVVHKDAVGSVYAAFTKEELLALVNEARYDRFKIKNSFPCRMLLVEKLS